MRQTLSIVLAFGMVAGPSMAETMAPVSVVGNATFKQEGQNWTITTTTDRTVINWSSFSVAEGARVHFQQPGVGSSVLNRALGSSASYINGLLSSNGSVYLFNPNGIVIGSAGVIRVADFVGTTLRITDSDFLAGKDINFKGGSSASIENMGKIEAIDGDIYLIAVNVVNKGTLTSSSGSVNLVAATDVLLTEDHKLFIRPSSLAVGAGIGIDNSGVIDAVVARLEAHGNMYALAINNTGIVRATGYSIAGGRVVMRAEGGSVVNTGSVIARTTGADGKTTGGEIQVLGDTVAITGNARIDASGDAGGGRILIGGDLRGANAAVHNARTTLIDSDAVVVADALVAGDGGTVIAWADGDMTARGTISVLGAGGGAGGFVETSGHTLDLAGLDLAIGQGGTWLVDAPAVIDAFQAGLIVAALNGGSSYIHDSPTNISVEAPIVATATPGNRFLLLKAATGIAIGENIDVGDGMLFLHAGGGATQAPGTTLAADKLWIDGSGEFNLNQPGNDFGTVAVSVTGNTSKVLIQDVDDLTIGRVLGTAGVTVRGGEVHITTPNGHILANGLLPVGTVTGYHALGNVRLTEESDGSGIYEIRISNNAPYNRSAAEVEAFLGSPGGLTSLDPATKTGSAVRVEFDNLAGDSLGYDWLFRTAETFNKSSANDYAFVLIDPIPGAPEEVFDVQSTLDLHKSDPHDDFSWWIDEQGTDMELNHTDQYALSLGAMNVDHDGIESMLHVREIRFTGHLIPPTPLAIFARIFDYVEDFPHVRPDLRAGNVGARPLAPTLDEVSTYFDQASQYTDPRYFYQSVGSIYQIPR